ncbi:hypothetical protein VTN00DRAFT_745 [Thermoascus crustaceus]|uniref:uncharacterized protein n=1 Tax=Thermoascus crustaceus TaxID=5088 RepID=UPI003741FF42
MNSLFLQSASNNSNQQYQDPPGLLAGWKGTTDGTIPHNRFSSFFSARRSGARHLGDQDGVWILGVGVGWVGVSGVQLLKTDVTQCVPSGVRLRAVSGAERELESWWSWSEKDERSQSRVIGKGCEYGLRKGGAEARIQRA